MLVVDVKEPVIIPGFKIAKEEVAVIDKRPALSRKLIEDAHLGGAGNMAPVAVKLGLSTGVAGYIGRDYAGEYFKKTIESLGADTSGIIETEWATDVSIIFRDESGKRQPIAFYENSGKYFDLTEEVKQRILSLRPRLAHIGYSGMFEYGADRNQGENMAVMVKWLQGIGCLVMVDTHTYFQNPERYELLFPVLPLCDMFMCSCDEMNLMIKRFKNFTSNQTDFISQAFAFLEYLENIYLKEASTPRIFAITDLDFVAVKYYTPGRKTIMKKVDNYFRFIKPIDKVGAGDSFRVGFNVYLLKNLSSFEHGELNLEEAVQMGNLAALLYMSGKGIDGFRNYCYDDLLNLIQKSSPDTLFTSIEDLYCSLEINR